MSIAVLADSAASLPPTVAKEHGIGIVPLQVIVDGVAGAEGVDIASDQVVAHLLEGAAVGTSQPTPASFDDAIAEAVARGVEGIVVLTMSGALSGTFEAARAAGTRAAVPVEVIDTGTVAMASGYAAVAAAVAAAEGADLAGVRAVAAAVSSASTMAFTVESLDHLRRGGRIGPAVAAVGKVLGIRPVLEVRAGEIMLTARVRSAARARAALLDIVDAAVARCARPAVAVVGVGCPELVAEAAQAIAERHLGAFEVAAGDAGAVLAAHAGPGAWGVAVADLSLGR